MTHRHAGSGTGGEVADAGQAGEERVHDLANLLGFLFFAIPASILLLTTLPGRIRQVRELNAGQRLFTEPASEERRRLIAMRAAFSLPGRDLVRHTKDPIGDLAGERDHALIAAAYAAEGLIRRPKKRLAHAELLEALASVAKQIERPLAVAGLVTGQHAREADLGMRDPGHSPEPLVHLQGSLEWRSASAQRPITAARRPRFRATEPVQISGRSTALQAAAGSSSS